MKCKHCKYPLIGDGYIPPEIAPPLTNAAGEIVAGKARYGCPGNWDRYGHNRRHEPMSESEIVTEILSNYEV